MGIMDNIGSIGIGAIGILTLLTLAWLFSNNKANIPYRIIGWGLSLQFIFALVILRDDIWGYIGLFVLGSLVIVYNYSYSSSKSDEASNPIFQALAPIATFSLIGLIVYYLGSLVNIKALLAILFLLKFFKNLLDQRVINSLIISVGITFMISNEYSGLMLFNVFSDGVKSFLDLSTYGASFMFGSLTDGDRFGFLFAISALPTIIFFGGFISVLYYLGIMQRVIEAMGRFMRWSMGTSGAESLSCSANVFVGQTEAPLLIKPYLSDMTKSELFTIMTGGFATIAGGVLAAYIMFGIHPGHLIAASLMSAPAAMLVSKIMFPETEETVTGSDEIKMPDIKTGDNVIEAATNGITDGLRLAVNVGAMLIGFIALVAVIDISLNFIDRYIDGAIFAGEWYNYTGKGMSPAVGEFAGYFPGSLQTFFGNILRPLAFLMGVPWQDSMHIANLLGIKLSLNEFVSYATLGTYISNGDLDPKSIIIASYALCGFANFSSIGIQIGGLSAIAPERKSDLAAIGLRAMFAGAIASWITATVAGVLLS